MSVLRRFRTSLAVGAVSLAACGAPLESIETPSTVDSSAPSSVSDLQRGPWHHAFLDYGVAAQGRGVAGLLGPDWFVAVCSAADGRISSAEGDTGRCTHDVEIDMDRNGTSDGRFVAPEFDLRFTHRFTGAQVFIGAVPVPTWAAQEPPNIRAEATVAAWLGEPNTGMAVPTLPALVDEAGTTGALTSLENDEVVANRVSLNLSGNPVTVSGRDAWLGTVEFVDANRLASNPAARDTVVRFAVIHAGMPWPVNREAGARGWGSNLDVADAVNEVPTVVLVALSASPQVFQSVSPALDAALNGIGFDLAPMGITR